MFLSHGRILSWGPLDSARVGLSLCLVTVGKKLVDPCTDQGKGPVDQGLCGPLSPMATAARLPPNPHARLHLDLALLVLEFGEVRNS